MKTNWKRAQCACASVLLSLLLAGFIGCGTKKSAARKRQESAKAAIAKGVPKSTDAQLDLAYKFYLGKEVTLNYAKAAELFKIAAEAGSSDAQFALGVMHQNGQGVPINYMDAAKWYEKAARQDNPNAQYLLGLSYKEGSGVAKDPAEAYKWMHLAAEQGNPDHVEARNHLALLLTPDIVAEGQRRAEQFHIYELASKNKARAEDIQNKQISIPPPEEGRPANN